MTSEVQIANLALGWLGGNLITSLDDDSKEAKLAKANFDFARDAVLEDHAWTFAAGRAVILPDLTTPEFEYSTRFLVPIDSIRVLTVDTNPNGYNDASWAKEENYILLNAQKIYMRYTKRITDPNRFTAAFTQALAQRIAADIAIPLTESRSMQQTHWSLYIGKLEAAAATDGMQGRNQVMKSKRLLGSRSGAFPGSSAGFGIGTPLP